MMIKENGSIQNIGQIPNNIKEVLLFPAMKPVKGFSRSLIITQI